MQIPINAAAFFLALFLVTAAATFAGGALGVALPTRITERPPIANVDGHADHRSIQTMGFSQDFNGNGWEQAELYQGRHRTSE